MPILPHLPPQGHSQDSASNHSPMSEVHRKLCCDGMDCESGGLAGVLTCGRAVVEGFREEGRTLSAELGKGMRAAGRDLNGDGVWGSQEELN